MIKTMPTLLNNILDKETTFITRTEVETRTSMRCTGLTLLNNNNDTKATFITRTEMEKWRNGEMEKWGRGHTDLDAQTTLPLLNKNRGTKNHAQYKN
jgi:hypothetical protein